MPFPQQRRIGTAPGVIAVLERHPEVDLVVTTGGVSAGASSRLLLDYPEASRAQLMDLPSRCRDHQHQGKRVKRLAGGGGRRGPSQR